MFYHYLHLIRIRQWTKNTLLFAPLLFARKLLDQAAFLQCLAAFSSFCLLSSFIYVLNDYFDREKDKKHPQKKDRPLASGVVKEKQAIVLAFLLLIFSFLISFLLVNKSFIFLQLFYLLLMLSYTFFLKNLVIIDVLVIATGFILRAYGGALAISVPLSTWLLICAFLLSLFLALAKRKNELLVLGQERGYHRQVLEQYSDRLLDQMLAISAASVIVCYALYTVDKSMISRNVQGIEFTLIFVIYGIFRYLYLIHSKNEGGKPEEILLSDIPLLTNIIIYSLFICVVLYGF
ncbi:decaprenyl-phosphate phosphoribosyltransferase [Candidatus Riflebacteria bacterium]